MNGALLSVLVRLAACAVMSWLAWHYVGATGLAVSAAGFGLLLAKPLLELAAEAWHGLRAQAYRDVEGQYYAYRGKPVRVIEDDDFVRWLRMADVRAVLGSGSGDAVLGLLHGEAFRKVGVRQEAYFSAEALLQHLSRDSRAEAGKFRLWVEREIARPARTLRSRHGGVDSAVQKSDVDTVNSSLQGGSPEAKGSDAEAPPIESMQVRPSAVDGPSARVTDPRRTD